MQSVGLNGGEAGVVWRPQFPACVYACMLRCFSPVWLLVTLWSVAHQAPLSMGFPRQNKWSSLLFPSPGHLPDPRLEPSFPALAGRFFTTEPQGKPAESESVSCSVVSDSATSRIVARQAPLPMGFSRQEYWSGLPFPSPGDLPNPGVAPWSPALQADSLLSEPPGPSREAPRTGE